MLDMRNEEFKEVYRFLQDEITILKGRLLDEQKENTKLREKIDELKKQHELDKAVIVSLQKENSKIKEMNERLNDEIKRISGIYNRIKDLYFKTKEENEELKKARQLRFDEVFDLRDEVVALKYKLDFLKAINKYNQKENEELKERNSPVSVFPTECTTLNKKPKKKEFKIGDRVMVRTNAKPAFKGTIINIDSNSNIPFPLSIKDDNGYFFVFKEQQCTKLVKRKPEFKVGDRVMVRPANGGHFKAEIIIIHKGQIYPFIIRADDGGIGAFGEPECTKIRKVKAKGCVPMCKILYYDKGTTYCTKCHVMFIPIESS